MSSVAAAAKGLARRLLSTSAAAAAAAGAAAGAGGGGAAGGGGLGELKAVWRAILRCHRAKLPGPMRALGDGYVGQEVRAHARSRATTAGQWAAFEREWRAYLAMLEGRADLTPQQQQQQQQQRQRQRDAAPVAAAAAAAGGGGGGGGATVVERGPGRSGELPPELLAAMTPAQREQLVKLRSAAESLARGGGEGADGGGEGVGGSSGGGGLDTRPLG